MLIAVTHWVSIPYFNILGQFCLCKILDGECLLRGNVLCGHRLSKNVYQWRRWVYATIWSGPIRFTNGGSISQHQRWINLHSITSLTSELATKLWCLLLPWLSPLIAKFGHVRGEIPLEHHCKSRITTPFQLIVFSVFRLSIILWFIEKNYTTECWIK